MIKLAFVFLPLVFAIIWMLFIGLNINKLNKKLIINFLIKQETPPEIPTTERVIKLNRNYIESIYVLQQT